MRFLIRAKFSTGDHIKRSTKLKYLYGWAVFRETQMIASGFAKDIDSAFKSATAKITLSKESIEIVNCTTKDV